MEESRQTVLIVDDEPVNISILMDLLRPLYRLVVAKDGAQALERSKASPSPDLILLDIMMPAMDGYEVCRRLKADEATRDIPVIFVSAMGQAGDEMNGLELGAVDYVTKPFSPPIVLARIKNHLFIQKARQELRNQNQVLEARVAERTRELALTQDVTILSLASLAETRDNETGNHIRRTQHYVRALAIALSEGSPYADDLDDRTIELWYKSAPLHDIGKVGVPDSILLKPGKLTEAEFEVMKTHTTLGRDAILQAEVALIAGDDNFDSESSFLQLAREIAYSHQEKWDGSGYPEGLAGEAIPLSARLMAVADVYDALISKRVYKPAFPHEKAVQIILEGKGAHFDPAIVEAFERVADDFRKIASQFQD